MAISFNDIPSTLRVPFLYAEFDNSNAVQGPNEQPYKRLLFGQKLAAGTAAADTLVRVTSAEQVKTLAGEGSQLHGMAQAMFAQSNITETWMMPVAEAGGGTQASGSIAITGPATESGTIHLYIAGRKVAVGVTSGDTATAIGDAIEAAITADTSLPVTANNTTGTVAITARGKGLYGNEIDIRVNYQTDEETPAGVALTITGMASGATNPTLTTAIAALGDEWFNVIAFGWTDSTSTSAMKAELSDRFGPLRMIDGLFFVSKNDTHANLGTFGDSHNSQHMVCMHSSGSPTPAYEWAAETAAIVGFYAPIDPARPLQTLPYKWCMAPKKADRFTMSENNILLYDGISTFAVDADGTPRVQTMITTYKQNAAGAADVSYLYVETMTTLSYIRYDFRTFFTNKYPRHKLANDGTNYGPGQAVMTPKVGKAEAINRYKLWETAGLVEDLETFKASLIVERNVTNRNRLDFFLPVDVVNQLRIVGAKIGFIL